MEKIKYATLLFLFIFTSCEDVTKISPKKRKQEDIVSPFRGTGKGLVYKQSPFDANNFSLPLSALSVSNWVDPRGEFITLNSELRSSCSLSIFNGLFETSVDSNQDCFKVLQNDSPETTFLSPKDAAWDYDKRSQPHEFYQVNGYYHSNLIIDKFLVALNKAHRYIHFPTSQFIYPSTKYDPERTFSFWYNTKGINKTLTLYSTQPLNPLNAYFDSSTLSIGMGYDTENFITTMYSIEDLSVLYHEYGHAFVYIMMNQRNTSFIDGQIPDPYNFPNAYFSTPYTSSLGSLFYDEGGSINEGIADFFAYFMTGRKELGEWAFNGISRPMTEESHTHTVNVSKSSGERLKYPDFVYYNNTIDFPDEDVHNSGQIVAHYLVELTENFKNKCTNVSAIADENAKHTEASTLTIMLLSETLAEIGDMNARGSDLFDSFKNGGDPYFGSFFTNLNAFESYRWAHIVRPPSFRRFFKIFAKNTKYRISDFLIGQCPSFSVDDSEQLLDEYGLLLFKSYEENKMGSQLTNAGTFITHFDRPLSTFNGQRVDSNFSSFSNQSNTSINELNRRHTVMVSKDFIDLPTVESQEPRFFIYDRRSGMEKVLSNLTFEGRNIQITEGIAGPEYNNGDIRVGPGEIIGITPNFFNYSNSTIGGVRVLGNDWDHLKLENINNTYVNRVSNLNSNQNIAHWLPCQFEGWPLETENGVVENPALPTTAGDCSSVTKHNLVLQNTSVAPRYYQDSPQPVCLVQYDDENETKWVSQDFFRKSELLIEDNECLNNPGMSGESFNPNECLVRVLPGATQAVFGKIESNKSWQKTLQGISPDAPSINSNHLLLFEISKFNRPGTVFNCRLRVNFSNCSDCFEDANGDEYQDYIYAGHKPFKLINFSFRVLN